jgi:GMP synthase-like glutamine amidotransferase
VQTAAINIVRHHASEGPGHIANWARSKGLAVKLFDATLGHLPVLDGSPCVLLGGPASVLQPPNWMLAEKRWLSLALARNTPLFSICLGAQLLAETLGATISTLAKPELGWCDIDIASPATGHFSQSFLQWHKDGFSQPPGTELIAQGKQCPVQGYQTKNGQQLGLQFHPEWNLTTLKAMSKAFTLPAPLRAALDSPNADLRFSQAEIWLSQQLDRWQTSWGSNLNQWEPLKTSFSKSS